MKKILYTFGLILFINTGYSQFLPTGTSIIDNKYRSGSLGIGYTSAPSFTHSSHGTYKFLVNGTSRFYGGIFVTPPDNATYQFELGSANLGSAIQLALAFGDYHFSNVSKQEDIIIRGMTSGSLIITNEGKPGTTGVRDIKFVTQVDNNTYSKVALLINKYGKVAIGDNITIPSTAGGASVANYRLFVKGGILTEEVRVNLQSQWADYVFEEDYELPKLEDVEKFIKENKHLPNVPSAKEVEDDGIELGEMTKIQQEKIEELTLYIIQQQKEINELKEQLELLIKNLENKNNN